MENTVHQNDNNEIKQTVGDNLEIRKELALEKVNEKRLQLNRVVSFINQEEKEFPKSKEHDAVMFDTLLTSLGIEFKVTETKKRIIFQLA